MKDSLTDIIVFVSLTLFIFVGRFTIPTRTNFSWPGTYEAFAHIALGSLLTYGILKRLKYFYIMFGVLTVFELVMVIINK